MIFIKIPTIVINSITIALMLITTFAVERIRANKQKTKFRWANIILSAVAGTLLFLFFTEPLVIFKNFLFVQSQFLVLSLKFVDTPESQLFCAL